ncbi:MAG TPA: outer membrane beta-barrel protein [Stellaceae bacterium]|nr:outer membrane beta-barrel protein [Stellaceae bacterium]
MKKLIAVGTALGWAGVVAGPLPALAQALPPGAPPPPAAPAPAAPAPAPMANPAMTGPLAANPNPTKFEVGGLGTVYVTGALTGLGLLEGNHFASDHDGALDISNGQAVVQKTDGMLQFYVQAGIYSLPALGAPYIRASTANSTYFGPLPEAYLKFAPNESFSVQAGKLPTLIGAEYTFTFENMNIERGLLWGQEPAISKGIQANYTWGPVAYSLSLNDGFDSDNFNWLSGLASWTINPANTLAVAAGGNFGTTGVQSNTFLTPTPQSNSTIVNLIYTYNNAPWTITPYFQYTNVPSQPGLGWTSGGSTYGGAVLVSYAFNSNFSLAGRGEIIGSSGNKVTGPNLLGYGPGSSAWSLTLTPTYQQGIFFVRGEGSIVQVSDTTPGSAFGKSGNAKTQGRVMLETGILF